MKQRVIYCLIATALAAFSLFADEVNMELPLPAVPDSLRTPAARASYIVAHFWDDMDFADTLRSRNRDFMEQNFVNYLSLFPHTPDDTIKAEVPKLMKRAEADTTAYNLLADLADQYLYDAESPMLDEESYIPFLETILDSKFMEPSRRSRFEYELSDAVRNRKGSTAADFSFIDSAGLRNTLYGSGDGKRSRILIFYDPDCDHCHDVINALKEDMTITDKLHSGEISILAVYADGDTEVWNNAKNSLPAEWINAVSPENEIEEKELYILRHMPTLYLLAPDNKVLLKDPSVRQLIHYINR